MWLEGKSLGNRGRAGLGLGGVAVLQRVGVVGNFLEKTLGRALENVILVKC